MTAGLFNPFAELASRLLPALSGDDGAHAVLRVKRDKAPLGAWLDRLDSRAHKNVVVVAMANKLARIAWAVLSRISCSGEKQAYRVL